ncbi:MAG: haloacid dehalogenase [Planctomycetes bacterium]|nr:haloacid dehalogenase [Planctomycetota bacterium]
MSEPAQPPAAPFRSIWFDCDSTLSAIEGIDELGTLRDDETRRAIAALTERAMAGELPLEAVYGERLRRIAPTAAECERLGARYVAQAVADAALVVAALHALGKRVGILSGGLRGPVLALAHALGVPKARVFAVGVRFDSRGHYVDFDRDTELWRSGGKTALLAARPADERPQALVGDGATDLEAAAAVDRFVGFGGVVVRPAVARGARFFTSSPRLAATLAFLLTRDEQSALRTDPRFANLRLE